MDTRGLFWRKAEGASWTKYAPSFVKRARSRSPVRPTFDLGLSLVQGQGVDQPDLGLSPETDTTLGSNESGPCMSLSV